MSKLYACIISADLRRDKRSLISVAKEFSYSIEVLDDGILFDVSGLGRLIGKPDAIAQRIYEKLNEYRLEGSIAVAETVDSACLIARQDRGRKHTIYQPVTFSKLPISDLPVEKDILNVLNDLGIHKVSDLLPIPRKDLTDRYGKDFRKVIDIVEQKGATMLVPNVKDRRVSWAFDLDDPVQGFEQLIFLLNHGLEKLFVEIDSYGLSTEQLDITLKLKDRSCRPYEIKTSFPTLERSFWLKLINLRISLDPPTADIFGVSVIAHFTHPRPDQKGLYAGSRPEPESLLLTVNKLKKLVGDENVGLPVILDQRLPEPFMLDANILPQGVESSGLYDRDPVLAFNYYRPARQVSVSYCGGRLEFIRTKHFEGRVREYSGVWRSNSKWWDSYWQRNEWDIEVENRGIYRLCRSGQDWFLLGEYD